MKKKNKLSIFILLFLSISILYPLIQMFLKVNWVDFKKLIDTQSFIESLTNSITIGLISTIISIALASLLAFSLNRTNIKHKNLLKMLIILPMLIPSISHGLGLINLFGRNGIISRNIGFNIIGPVGIVLGSILYSFPVAFLMIDDGYKYIDNNLYINAKVLGLNKWQTFKKVTFCYLKKPIFSAIFAVFTMIFTDYGVPLAVGGKFITLPVYLYKEVIGLLNYSTGTLIGLFLLIPAFLSFIFDNFTKNYISEELENNNYIIKENKLRDNLYKLFTYIVIICIFIIIGSFIYYAFIDNIALNPTFSTKHFEYVIENDLIKYIFNSIIIAIFTSIIGTIITYFTAYVTGRVKGKLSKIIHILAILSLTIPGIVLGLSYTLAFNNSFIYNTFIILILVNIVHFIASPYLMAYNALQKVNSNYEIVAKTCNISTFKIIKDVIMPSTKTTIREMFSYFFINSMVTISAVAFLFNTKTMPLSLLINNYEGNLMLGEAAIISLIILFFNITLKCVIYIIRRKEEKNYEFNTKTI